MLNHETRSAVLRLSAEGHSVRFIAKALGIGRESAKSVIKQNTAIVPDVARAGRLDPFLAQIRELDSVCGGNLVRVHEELRARHGVVVPYSTLTRFCRDAEIGVVPKQAAGRYHFAPGKEMQHDTSPHDVKINGRITRLQCASLVMCFSRRRFIQCYLRWTRFHVKVFLTAALRFLGASAEQCMLDNSTVIMTGGTGPDAVAVPEMKAFADRFGFKFVAHRVGDANRSARVEGPFWHVENNFYPGRTFADLRDLNAQAITWCRDYNGKYHKKFDGIPDELGANAGRYGLLRLPNRATPRPVPRVTTVDLEALEGDDRPMFAPVVVDGLSRALAAGGKAIVLYNRRGYATVVQCTACGGTYECTNCGITLTLHRGARVLACHYCGLKRSYDANCPKCRKPTLDELGKGTEQIAETLEGLFPGVPIGRMDADTTAVRGSHHRILEDFRHGRTRILVGTQIISKGHDFPDVHVAVVVSADHGLRIPDFRSAERTYALLVQTAGRAGRGDVPGEVFVQTWAADHYALQHLDDPDAFYAAELRVRRTLRYPPVHRLVLIRLDGVDRRVVQDHAAELARELRAEGARGGVEVLGPAPAALPRLVGRWRFQIVLRAADARTMRVWLDRHRDLPYRSKHTVRLTVDVDPRHLM
jgi:primosomal protein N'